MFKNALDVCIIDGSNANRVACIYIHIPNSVKSLTRKNSILLYRFDNNKVQIHKLLGLTAVEIYFLVCSKLI